MEADEDRIMSYLSEKVQEIVGGSDASEIVREMFEVTAFCFDPMCGYAEAS